MVNARPFRALVLPALVMIALAHQLSADGRLLSSTYPTSTLYRGVSLEDLARSSEEEVSPSLDRIAALVREYVATQKDLSLHKVLSVSLHEFRREAGTMTVDILGRDHAFAVVDRDGLGGLGFIRAEVEFATAPGNPSEVRVTGHRIVLQRDWVDLSPSVTVSLGDRLALVQDEDTGFRRIFPLGVGSIDRVHFKGVTTILTPTTELAVLEKGEAIRKRAKPTYYKKMPFIPLSVPVALPEGGRSAHLRRTAIAFHIWQSPKFQRGFLSHGCMRMRDGDLLEMLAFVEGSKSSIPVKVRVERIAGADHPYPKLGDRYSEVENFGTSEHPVAHIVADAEGVRLTALKTSHGEPPSIENLRGTSMDPAAYGPVAGGLMEQDNESLENSAL